MSHHPIKKVTPSSSAGYEANGNFVMCSICGFRYRAYDMRKKSFGPHKGLWICPNDWDDPNSQWEPDPPKRERIVPDLPGVYASDN